MLTCSPQLYAYFFQNSCKISWISTIRHGSKWYAIYDRLVMPSEYLMMCLPQIGQSFCLVRNRCCCWFCCCIRLCWINNNVIYMERSSELHAKFANSTECGYTPICLSRWISEWNCVLNLTWATQNKYDTHTNTIHTHTHTPTHTRALAHTLTHSLTQRNTRKNNGTIQRQTHEWRWIQTPNIWSIRPLTDVRCSRIRKHN